MMRNNLGAAKRLRKELQHLEKADRNGDTDSDIYLRPTSSSSLLHWTALIRGPVGEFGTYLIETTISIQLSPSSFAVCLIPYLIWNFFTRF